MVLMPVLEILLLTHDRDPQAFLAAREVRRYVYAATGELAAIRSSEGCDARGMAPLPGQPGGVLLISAPCAKAELRRAMPDVMRDGNLVSALNTSAGLHGEEHLVYRLASGLTVLGGSGELAMLYAAYRFAELALGVHFTIGTDIIRPQSLAAYAAGSRALRSHGGVSAPNFAVRGLHPFHDFNEGPDLWTIGNYKSYAAQMSKLRLNLLAVHDYAYYKDGARGVYDPSQPQRYVEPAVWLGPPADVDAAGRVRSSYRTGMEPVSWHSSCMRQDGVPATAADDMVSGADLLFGTRCVPERWQPLGPSVDTEAAHIAAFDDAAALFAAAFPHARARGVRTAVGSEAPAAPPKRYNTTLVYLNAFAAPADHLLTTGYYPCQFSTACPWMCGEILPNGTRRACGSSFAYASPYLHHNIQGWVHSVQSAGTVPLATYYNGTSSHGGNTLLWAEASLVAGSAAGGGAPHGKRPPQLPCCGYRRVRTEGFVYPPSLVQRQLPPGVDLGSDLHPLTLWVCDRGARHCAGNGDYFATSSPLLERAAAALNYTPAFRIGFVYARRPRRWLAAMYEGALLRATRAFPLDYFWLWTQEIWGARFSTNASWAGLDSDLVSSVVDDLLALDAARAAANLSADSLGLVASGWTLGPRLDRAFFDRALPREGWSLASLDELLGTVDVEAAYKNVTRHDGWLMPWVEDDPHLGMPQLWVSRTLAHLRQGRGYGASGAVPITWRMESVWPTIYAAARFGWNESGGPLRRGDNDASGEGDERFGSGRGAPVDPASRPVWAQWAAAEFGLRTSDDAAAFAAAFASLEGAEQELLTSGCPGTIQFCPEEPGVLESIERRTLALLALAPRVSSDPQHSDRWRKWSSLLTFTVASAQGACTAARYRAAASVARALPSNASAARRDMASRVLLPLRELMVVAAANLTTLLLEATDGPGEIGMLTTVHDTVLTLSASDSPYGENLLNASAAGELEGWLGAPLPPHARRPAPGFHGTERIVMDAPRSTADAGERLQLTARLLSRPPLEVTVLHRRLGMGGASWSKLPMARSPRGQVYHVELPPAIGSTAVAADDLEYYVKADLSGRAPLYWPPGAPQRTQTVVIAPIASA